MRTTNNANTKELSWYLDSNPLRVTLHETASGMLATFFVLLCTGSIPESQLMVSLNALALLSYIERLLRMLSGIVRWKQSFVKPIK